MSDVLDKANSAISIITTISEALFEKFFDVRLGFVLSIVCEEDGAGRAVAYRTNLEPDSALGVTNDVCSMLTETLAPAQSPEQLN
jgi:hypothetical protein